MTPQVMISFSSKNVPAVEKILRRIEDAGLRCWVSHRDIKQGQNYQGSITAAIRDASAVVFVLCKEFNLSEETKRELSLASSFKKPMVPIRTEAFTFSDELVYVLATVQYIDAFPDFDAALSRMIVRLKEIVAAVAPPVADAAPSLLPPTAAAGVAAAADKYTETARQVFADGIVTPAERVKLDTALELLDIPVDVAAQIEQRFAPATRSDAIQVFVSYEGGKYDQKNVKVRSELRWKSLRAILKLVADEVMTRAMGYEAGDKVLDIRFNRLRGQHGQFILGSLQQRIERGDILIMDIGSNDGAGLNSNLRIELEIALGLNKMAWTGLFILKPKDAILPSDLRGILITEYTLKDGKIQIVDSAGLRAALRTTLVNLAAKRRMIGAKKKPGVEIEEENPKS